MKLLIFAKYLAINFMVDLAYLAFLEQILTEERKAKFLKILANRTNYFTVVVEDVFQLQTPAQ